MAITTPKFKSGEFKTALAQLKEVFDAHSLGVVLLDALDRKSAEQIVSKFAKGAIKARLKVISKTELMGQITGWFFESEEVAYQVLKEMDKSCQKERHIVASIPEEHAPDRVGSYRAIALKRERAKLVWALARDERETVRGLASKVILEFFVEVADQERAKETLSGEGATIADDVELARRIQAQAEQLAEAASKVTTLESKLSKFESERARLMAEIGAKQRNLMEATEARGELESQLRGLEEKLEDVEIKEKEAEDARQREQEARAMAEDLQQKIRRLEKLAGAAESLGEAQSALDEARRKNSELVRQLQRSEQSHRKEREDIDRERARLRREADALKDELRIARARIADLESGVDAPRESVEPGGVVLLLDQANLAATAKDTYGRKVDFSKLYGHLAEGRPVTKAVAFVVDNGGPVFDKFCEILRLAGWELRIKKPKRFADGRTKADWDMGIAIEAVEQSGRASTLVLASGDGDFAPLMRYLKRQGLRVETASFPEGLASELENVSDRTIRLGSDILE